MSGRIDYKVLEQRQKEFITLCQPTLGEIGTHCRSCFAGQNNYLALTKLYNRLHNLRHMAYSVGLRNLGEFLNNFERLIRQFQEERPVNKETELMLIHRAYFCLMNNLGILMNDIHSNLDFFFEGRDVLQELKGYSIIPPVRKLNVLILGSPDQTNTISGQLEGINSHFCHTPDEMMIKIKETNLDCLIVDLDTNDFTPSGIIKAVRKLDPRLKVVMLKNSLDFNNPEYVRVGTKAHLLLEKAWVKENLKTYIQVLLSELL